MRPVAKLRRHLATFSHSNRAVLIDCSANIAVDIAACQLEVVAICGAVANAESNDGVVEVRASGAECVNPGSRAPMGFVP